MRDFKGAWSVVIMAAVAAMLCLGLAGCSGEAGSSSSAAGSASTAVSSASEAASDSSSSSAEKGESSTSQDASSSADNASESAERASSASGSEAASASISTSATGNDPALFVGTWEMVAMSDGTDVLTVDSMDEAARASVAVTLALNADGSCSFSYAGSDATGKWLPTSDATLAIQFDAIEGFDEVPIYTATLEDGVLAIEEDGLVMLLERAE